MIEVELFFDCTCVWAYLAHHHAQRLAETAGITLRWRPVLSDAIYRAVNPSALAPLSDVKQAYYAKDLRLWADYLGCPLATAPPPPSDAADCMRACIAAGRWGLLEPFAKAAFTAAWAHGADLADRTVLARLWKKAGLPEPLLAPALDWAEIDRELNANARELASRGGFGTPTFFVGDDLYFGNDAIPLLERAVITRLKDAGIRISN